MLHRLRVPTLYLVRHGEPAITGVMLGRTDPPLSEHGRAQCAALKLDVVVIYSSPLRRARESAEAVPGPAVPVVVLPGLVEISLGDWDGLSWSEIERRDPEGAAAKLRDWLEVTPPAGEPWGAFTARVDNALDAIRQGVRPAAVIAHLTVNAWIAHRLAGADPTAFTQEYAQIYEFSV